VAFVALLLCILSSISFEIIETASNKKKDYYEILGVRKDATDREIQRAFHRLSKKYHPDKIKSAKISDKEKEEAKAKWLEISKAYEVLGDKDKRKEYDLYGEPDPQQPGFGGANPFGFGGFGNGFDGRNIRVEFERYPGGSWSGHDHGYEGAGNGFTFNFGGFDWSNLFGSGGSRPHSSGQHSNQKMRPQSRGRTCSQTTTCRGGVCETRTVCN